ncbi:TolC family protein [Martelella sp. FOR1707]
MPAALSCALLAGCAALPEPDGTEAAIIARAETLSPLTPTDATDMKGVAHNGLVSNPSVQEAASLVSASADEVRVQRAKLFPSLSLSAGAGQGDASRGDPLFELTGGQLLYDGGSSQRVIKIADYDLQIDYIAFQQAVDDAVLDVLEAYDEARMLDELLTVYQKQFAALSELETLVEARTENGAAARTDILEARKSVQSAAFLVSDTRLALAEARDRLVLLGGPPEGGRVTVAPESCDAQVETDDMRLAQLKLARAEMALEKAMGDLTPRVSLEPVLRGELGTNALPVGVNLNIQSDFLQGGALTARANAARKSFGAAKARLDAVLLEERINERGLSRSISANEEKSLMLKQQIQLLADTRELFRSQYFNMGTRRLSELLDNEEEYYSRQAELVQLRSELVADRLDCAVRSRELRRSLDLESHQIYGFPLSTDMI